MEEVDQPALVDTLTKLEMKAVEINRFHAHLAEELERMDKSKRVEAAKAHLYLQAENVWFLKGKALKAVENYASHHGWEAAILAVAEQPHTFGALKGWDVPGLNPTTSRSHALSVARAIGHTLSQPTELAEMLWRAQNMGRSLGQAAKLNEEMAKVLSPVVQKVEREREEERQRLREQERQLHRSQSQGRDRGGMSY